VKIVGIVMDNASVNLKLYERVQEVYPHFIRLPCTAHIVQLCVQKILKIPSIQKVIAFMDLILTTFRSNNALHNKLKKIQSDLSNVDDDEDVEVIEKSNRKQPYVLLRPNDTRWSSSLLAAERILLLQHQINYIAKDHCTRILEEDENENSWKKMEELVKILKPFQEATNILQSDSSTLYTVYKSFTKLLKTVNEFQSEFIDIESNTMKNIVHLYWKKHVNIHAVIMSAKFSMDEFYDSLFSPADIGNAKDWFIHFCEDYIYYYKHPNDSRTKEDISSQIIKQYARFQDGSTPFDKLHNLAEKNKNNVKNGKINSNYACDIKELWSYISDEVPELAGCALALLTLPSSEASVERSFSQQGIVHRKLRNRLGSNQIENEMKIKINCRPPPPIPKSPVREQYSLVPLESCESDAEQIPVGLFDMDSEEINNELNEIELLSNVLQEEVENNIVNPKKCRKNHPPPFRSSNSSPLEPALSSQPPLPVAKKTRVSERTELILPVEEYTNINNFIIDFVTINGLKQPRKWNDTNIAHLDLALSKWPVQILDTGIEIRKKINNYIKQLSTSSPDSLIPPSSPNSPPQQSPSVSLDTIVPNDHDPCIS
jgi:hypothetical protein